MREKETQIKALLAETAESLWRTDIAAFLAEWEVYF